MDFNGGRFDVVRLARVRSAVLHSRLLDDERAHRRLRLVRQHRHPAACRRVIDQLKNVITYLLLFEIANVLRCALSSM